MTKCLALAVSASALLLAACNGPYSLTPEEQKNAQLGAYDEQGQCWRYARTPPHNIPLDFKPSFWRPMFEADVPTYSPPAA